MIEKDDMDYSREVIENSLWYPKARFFRIGQKPLKGRFNEAAGEFTSKSGFTYVTTELVRYNGTKFLVWGRDGLMGEVRVEEG